MLRSNRYLLLASSIGIVSVVLLMLLYRHLALSSLVDHETRSNVALTEVFANSIWPEYAYMVGAGAKGVEIRRGGPQHPEIRRLDADVRHLMRGSKVVKVKVYDLRGLTLYSSDPSQIGEDKSTNEGFLSARGGEAASNITYRDQFDAFDGRLSDLNVVSSYIPIRARSSGRPEAVFEVYSDVTELIREMRRVQWRIVTGVFGSMALLYVLLVSTARRADGVEKRRRDEAAQSEARIHYQAYHDPVTDLPNRLSFQETLEQAIMRAERRGSLLAVLFLDLDRFKLVNDSFGHLAGDELLRLTAARLRGCVRQSDTLFRMGGDEFTILPEGLDYPEGAVRLAKRILEAMEEPFMIDEHSIVSTISIGIAIYPKDDVEPAKLVKNADAAMYLAKEAGRNQFRFYTREMNESALEQLALESALQQAQRNNEFILHYQPRIAADGVTVVGFEALIRWRRADGRLEPPGRFIPVLEQTGLITEVGQWVLWEACSQCKAWEAAGHDPIRISVNVSPRQFRDGDFVSMVAHVLASSELDARYLELELTESVLLDKPDAAIVTMHALKALGVVLSIDDFGTGYSSFSYLKHLPVDYLKIDRSFVRDVNESAKDAAIIGAIAGVAHSLGMELVAEGVEEPAQRDRMLAVGCHELQGFLYSKPVPAEAAETWLSPVPERRALAG